MLNYHITVNVRIVKGAVFCLENCFLLHCVPLYVCRLCINFQDLCARLLGMAAHRILLLTFSSPFVIDFLSIRKVTRKMVPIMGRASS